MKRAEQMADLDHEVADAAMENGSSVVPTLSQDKEVLAGAWGDVTVQLQVQVSQIGVKTQVALLLWFALHPHPGPLILRDHVHSCGRQ